MYSISPTGERGVTNLNIIKPKSFIREITINIVNREITLIKQGRVS